MVSNLQNLAKLEKIAEALAHLNRTDDCGWDFVMFLLVSFDVEYVDMLHAIFH